MTSCEIELAGPQITACSQRSSFLPSAITQDMFCLELPSKHTNGFLSSNFLSVTVDNFLSPSHTLVQIFCQDHKGLIYDTMRTLKDYNIQVYDLHWLELFPLFCWKNFHLLELSWCLEGVYENSRKEWERRRKQWYIQAKTKTGNPRENTWEVIFLNFLWFLLGFHLSFPLLSGVIKIGSFPPLITEERKNYAPFHLCLFFS